MPSTTWICNNCGREILLEDHPMLEADGRKVCPYCGSTDVEEVEGATELQPRIVGKVYKTENYAKFKTIEGNRDAYQPHRLKKIRKSIDEVGLVPAPIIVNEKMEIIDGQGRFTVCKEKGLPIYYYMIPGLTREECIAMNISSSNWAMSDYIKSYADVGYKDYAILQHYIDKYPWANMAVLSYVFSSAPEGGSFNNVIKNGKFKIDPVRAKDADKKLDWLSNTLDKAGDFNGSKGNFMVALLFCYDLPEIDNKRLAEKIRKQSFKFKSYSTKEDWLVAFEEIYNYKSKGEKVYLKTAWQKAKEEKKNNTKEDKDDVKREEDVELEGLFAEP
jgi:DNA-directed RNA polymerase subunit RPC12/RpoP